MSAEAKPVKRPVQPRPEVRKRSRHARSEPAPGRFSAALPPSRYVLRLFVAGATARSQQAVRRLGQLCAAELKGRCELEVIDIYQQPALARAHQIVATPTLIREYPQPVRRFIGNLTNLDSLWADLEQPPASARNPMAV